MGEKCKDKNGEDGSGRYTFHVVPPCGWEQVWQLADHLSCGNGSWYFRGMTDAHLPLEMSLERAAKAFRSPCQTLHRKCKKGRCSYWEHPHFHGLADVERRMLLTFRPEAHLRGVELPYDASPLEWLCLLRHYEGPTRLLDFTRSFWAAVFFALYPHFTRRNGGANPAVWAVSKRQIVNARFPGLVNKRKAEMEEASRQVCLDHMMLDASWGARRHVCRERAAMPFEPEFLNERQRAQQGAFIFPLNDHLPFEENLFKSLNLAVPAPSKKDDKERWSFRQEQSAFCEVLNDKNKAILEILLPTDATNIEDACRMLEQLNITWPSLFPDLKGISQHTIRHIWH